MITLSNLSGALVSHLFLNLAVIALLGVVILAAYRRRIRTLMRGGDTIAVTLPPEKPGQSALRFSIIAPSRIAHARSQSRNIPLGVFGVEFLGGLCFAVLAAFIWLSLQNTAILPIRFAAVTLCFFLPFLILVFLVIGPDRRLQSIPLIAFLALGALLAIAILIRQPEGSLKLLSDLLIGFFLFLGGGSFVLSLGLFNRSLRAIWPTLLIFILLCSAGMIVQAGLNSVFGDAALHLYSSLAVSIGFGAYFALALAFLPGFLLGLMLSGWLIAQIATWNQQGRLGDQSLLHNAIWGGTSVNLFLSFFLSAKPQHSSDLIEVVFLSCLPFLAYLGVTKIGYYFLHVHFKPIPGKPILYLRVFGYSRRASRLADLLRARWRYRGSLRLIAARDLAGRVITPVTLRAFLLRRLKEFFIETQGDLERKIASLRSQRDRDGSFRTELFFCNGGSWRETVRRLMTESHGVVMDLRSFNRQNHGCVFELRTLLDFVAVSRIMLIVDSRPGPAQTDVAFLQEVMAEAWTHLAVTSPNHAIAQPLLRLVDAASGDANAVAFIIGELEAL
jgi:hypothetical protein